MLNMCLGSMKFGKCRCIVMLCFCNVELSHAALVQYNDVKMRLVVFRILLTERVELPSHCRKEKEKRKILCQKFKME